MQNNQKNDISAMLKKAKEFQDAFNKASDSFYKTDVLNDTYSDVLDLIVGVLENQQQQDKEIASIKSSLIKPPQSGH